MDFFHDKQTLEPMDLWCGVVCYKQMCWCANCDIQYVNVLIAMLALSIYFVHAFTSHLVEVRDT